MADDPPRKPKLIIRDSVIADTPIGINAPGGIEIDADNVEFRNVDEPWRLGDNSSGSIKNTKIRDDPNRQAWNQSFSGWRKPKGPRLPVFCPQCKSVFASRIYDFGGQFWHFWGNEEPCILCGFEGAKLSDGTFNLAREIAEIITAPDITYVMLRAVQGVAENGIAGTITPEKTIRQTTKINAKIGKWLRAAFGTCGMGALTLLGTAASVGSLMLAQEQTAMQRSSKTDHLLEEILKKLDGGGSKSMVAPQTAEQDPEKQRRPVPSKEQAPSETGSIKTPSQHGQKPVRPPSRDSKRGSK